MKRLYLPWLCTTVTIYDFEDVELSKFNILDNSVRYFEYCFMVAATLVQSTLQTVFDLWYATGS